MPIPDKIAQKRIIINGNRAGTLGRKPTICKPWREKVHALGPDMKIKDGLKGKKLEDKADK